MGKILHTEIEYVDEVLPHTKESFRLPVDVKTFIKLQYPMPNPSRHDENVDAVCVRTRIDYKMSRTLLGAYHELGRLDVYPLRKGSDEADYGVEMIDFPSHDHVKTAIGILLRHDDVCKKIEKEY